MDVEQVFLTFCAFGAGSNVVPMMDGAHFGKLFRDLKLLDKKLTSTAVDIIFAKAKGKTDRKISYDQFRHALVMCAEEKYPTDPSGLKKLERKIVDGAGPASSSTRVVNTEHVERMTDTTLYTGLHKERFDDEGKGLGLVGRDHASKGQGHIPALVMDQPGYVAAYKSAGTYNTEMKLPPKPEKGDVLDRLTDTSKYTGSHKHRFDSSGQGKGMSGRDLAAKGPGMSPGSVSSQAAYVSGYRNKGTYGKK